MLLMEFDWVVKHFMFNFREDTTMSFYGDEITLQSKKLRVDIYRSLNDQDGPCLMLRIYEGPDDLYNYLVYNFNEFLNNPDRELLKRVNARQLVWDQ